jgi:hypothetical protein
LKVNFLYVYADILEELNRGVMKGREINIVELHGLWKYKRCFFSIIGT